MKQYHKNPRQITKKAYEQLEEWLRELGDLSGVVHDLNSGEIIGGNQRSKVFDIDKCAIEYTNQFDNPDDQGTVANGFVIWEGKRYAYREVRWNEKQCEKANIIANKAGGVWDFDTLANEFEFDDLLEWGFDEKELLGLNFGKEEPKEDAGAQVDKAEELREKWQTASGQLWQLGKHRLICGDCTDKAVVERVMGGEKAGLLVTSPPYFNQREYAQWETYEKYLDFVKLVVDVANNALSTDSIFVVNIGSDEQARRWMPSDWWCIIRDSGGDWLYRECIAWVKKAAVWSVPRSMHIEKGHYFPALRWEIMLVASRGKHPSFDLSDKDKVRAFDENVWEIGVVTGGEQKALGHNAPYPVEIPERFTMVYTQKSGTVYEPFSGSGTTLIACERLGRVCRAVEISPAYVAVALQRYYDTTGDTPVLLSEIHESGGTA